MATAKIYQQNGSERGTVDLPAELFDVEVNQSLVHQAVVAYQANQRQGNASTKERSDVRGGGRKPFRQKGTGRARQGTIRSPLNRGGGVVFGPHPRSYRKALPKKMRRLALLSSLSSRAKDEAIAVVDDLNFSAPKTKQFADLMKAMNIAGSKTLVVLDAPNEMIIKSARNIPRVKVVLAGTLSTYDVVWADNIVLTESGLKKLEGVSE